MIVQLHLLGLEVVIVLVAAATVNTRTKKNIHLSKKYMQCIKVYNILDMFMLKMAPITSAEDAPLCSRPVVRGPYTSCSCSVCYLDDGPSCTDVISVALV